MKPSTYFSKRIVWLTAVTLIVAFIAVIAAAGWIQDWLWMKQVGYGAVFWRILSIKLASAGLALAVAFCFLGINFLLVVATIFRLRGQSGGSSVVIYTEQGVVLPLRWARVGAVVVAAVIAMMFAATYLAQWHTYLRFHWTGAFGQTDPIYGKDLGFYLFRLPFYELVRSSLMGLTFVALAAAALGYGYFKVFQPQQVHAGQTDRRVVGHLSLLLLFFISSWGWGYYLDRYDLLFGTQGVVYGMGFTAFHFERIGYWVMLFAALAFGIFIIVCFLRHRLMPILIGAGGFVLLYFFVLILVPGLVQKYKVEPSELELETPFLEHNIAYTRQAFQLDRIVEKAYPSLEDLTSADLDRHQSTLDNIRLWDWRPILQTYRQTQEIRLYYEFYAVDVDRYHLADGYHQVMLSARELAAQLPPKARTWLNERLQFTHGYGLVMSFVSTQKEGGLPVYALENIPPVSSYGLKVTQPAIFYGEKMPGYRIVDTQVKEFDYPKGNDNVYTNYGGKGGIALDSAWKKLLFAWTQSDINILLSSYLTTDSRIQIHRDVQERVAAIAPFLLLDQDPYIVLADGRLFWIQDAYTISDRFPYSQPSTVSRENLNYIRNSVKVLVDVYDGTVSFYTMDPDDPVLGVYRRAFPGMFRALSELPPDLKAHLRYPEDLFAIQASSYMNYHMTDPQVFYNQEDLWALPMEQYAGQAVDFQPYYILMRMPDTDELKYFLMMPFTPQGRDNMISWMGAECDFPGYGHIIVYQLPKEKLTYGPLQIEAMIDQNAVISEQLSLWDQRGSRVIRGNLVVIPIDNSFLYVEPVYLLAEGVNIPQLIRVIVISGNKVVMEPTLAQAIQAVFGQIQPTGLQAAPATGVEAATISRVKAAYDEAEKAMRDGQWDAFGKAMENLKDALNIKPENAK